MPRSQPGYTFNINIHFLFVPQLYAKKDVRQLDLPQEAILMEPTSPDVG